MNQTSADLPKFVFHLSAHFRELRKVMGTGEPMIPVPLLHLKFLEEFAACDAGTSNGRH
jgi:hypothetical protein